MKKSYYDFYKRVFQINWKKGNLSRASQALTTMINMYWWPLLDAGTWYEN